MHVFPNWGQSCVRLFLLEENRVELGFAAAEGNGNAIELSRY